MFQKYNNAHKIIVQADTKTDPLLKTLQNGTFRDGAKRANSEGGGTSKGAEGRGKSGRRDEERLSSPARSQGKVNTAVQGACNTSTLLNEAQETYRDLTTGGATVLEVSFYKLKADGMVTTHVCRKVSL